MRGKDRVEDLRDALLARDERQTPVEAPSGGLERGESQGLREAQVGVAEQRIVNLLALGELELLVSASRALSPMTDAPEAARSRMWSRKAQLCGVQPRAPGSVIPALRQRAGTPVRG